MLIKRSKKEVYKIAVGVYHGSITIDEGKFDHAVVFRDGLASNFTIQMQTTDDLYSFLNLLSEMADTVDDATAGDDES